MSRQLEHLTAQQHYEHGQAVSVARDALLEALVAIAGAEGKNSRPADRLRRALKLIDGARCDLDDIMLAEHPAQWSAEAWYPYLRHDDGCGCTG